MFSASSPPTSLSHRGSAVRTPSGALWQCGQVHSAEARHLPPRPHRKQRIQEYNYETRRRRSKPVLELHPLCWQVHHCHCCYNQGLFIIHLPTNVLITAEIVPCQTYSTIKEFLLYQWAWLNNIVTFRIISSWFILLVISHVDGAEWGLLSRVRRLILWVNTAQWIWKMHKSLSHTIQAGHIQGKCRVCKQSHKKYNTIVLLFKSESRQGINSKESSDF